MSTELRLVDNRTFLLGLDELYRAAVKQHERTELLECARCVAKALRLTPGEVPIEGYYAEDAQLTEYFRLVRALQDVPLVTRTTVESLPEFRRLLDVTSARMFGYPQDTGLLPVGRDALTMALMYTSPKWTIHKVITRARALAEEDDDFSLVGLAARVEDAVVLTATRESVVLYAEVFATATPPERPRQIRYVWKVDKEVAEQARRFIAAYTVLFGEELPPSEAAHAEEYWLACQRNSILGRCVRIGNDGAIPPRHYHWGIWQRATARYEVQEFWHSEIWTTERYREALKYGGRHPDLS